MNRRLLVLVGLFSSLVLSPRAVMAVRLDGLDCDQFQEIPAERCAKWKEENANGRWWCHWNLAEGRINALLGSRGEPISPGLDLTKITRESARRDIATRRLLEVYAKQQIRQHESVFGFQPNGYELSLVGFQRRPAGIRRTLQADGSTLEEPLPAVSILQLQQLVRQHRLDNATIELSVDDENRLVSMFSTFVVDIPPNLQTHRLSAEEVAAIGVQAASPGRSLGTDDSVTAERTYSVVEGDVVPTYQVSVSLEEPEVSSRVVVHGRNGSVLKLIDELNHHSLGDDHSDFLNGVGRVFPRNPPVNASNGFFAGPLADFLLQEDVPLLHLKKPDPGDPFTLDGYFLFISNREQVDWVNDIEPRFVLPLDFLGIEIDFEPDNGSGGTDPAVTNARDARRERVCRGDLVSGQSAPDALEFDDNAAWSSRRTPAS